MRPSPRGPKPETVARALHDASRPARADASWGTMVAMTPRHALAALLLALGAASCGSGDDTATTTTSSPPAADPQLLEELRAIAGERAPHVLEVRPGDPVQVTTNLPRDAEAGPIGLGLCINAQAVTEAGADVQVLAADGGVLASTRSGTCAARV